MFYKGNKIVDRVNYACLATIPSFAASGLDSPAAAEEEAGQGAAACPLVHPTPLPPELIVPMPEAAGLLVAAAAQPPAAA